jgi:hypothetical protein
MKSKMTNEQFPMTNDPCFDIGHWCLVIGHFPRYA